MLLKRIRLTLALAVFVGVLSMDTASARLSLQEKDLILKEQGFTPWVWLMSQCHTCQMVIVPTHNDLESLKTQLFLQALSTKKFELLRLYPQIHGEEYNMLAHIAVGILGRESAFFISSRYHFKETAPWAVSILKVIQAYLDGKEGETSPNSRGPTQIKIVPEAIAKTYGVTSKKLADPTNAALATMGYLLEALPELKKRAKNNQLQFITPKTYPDYLPYIYFGATQALLQRTATPDKNIYIRDMKKYMSMVRIYQRPIL